MAHDPKLVAVVANAPVEIDGYDRLFTVRELLEYGSDRHTDSRADSQVVLARALTAILDAIDASGTYWVAPWEATDRMAMTDPLGSYTRVRDACLAERRGDAR